MVPLSLTSIARAVVRRRVVAGSCAACHTTVFGDEQHLRLHGTLIHRRCAAYRRRL